MTLIVAILDESFLKHVLKQVSVFLESASRDYKIL